MRCENVANGLQQCGGRMRMRCLQIAKTWRTDVNALLTDCECVANGLQQRGGRMRMRCLQIANAWRTDCNNATLKNQKPYFCNSKTPFLHVKNHTFAWRICNIQKTNTLQTFRECILNVLRMRGEYVYVAR